VAQHCARGQTAMFLGIDCGTQGTKALLVSDDGRTVGRGYAKHKLTERPNGAREQDPAWWVEAMKLSVRSALEAARAAGESGEVHALAISGQQHGLVVLDAQLEVIRPAKLWNDTETAAANAEIIERLGGREAWFERFGIVPLTGYTVSKLVWLQKHEPENFARVRHVLLPHEYLNWWLTGEFRAEAGDASGTAFFDNRTRQWSREVLDAIDGGTGQLFSALPELSDVYTPVGKVRAEAASELGLTTNCLVAAGGGDNMMGAIGTGNVREGVVTLSLGTSSTVYSYAEQPAHDPTGNVAPFCSSSGGWLPLVCTMNATNVVTQTVGLVGKTVAEIDGALEATTAGADGLTFLPFLNGERTPDLPTAQGSLVGISAVNFTPQHLIRAAVEGVSFGILNGLDLVLAGRAPEVVQVIGGGARSRGWRQLLADATGATVQVPAEEEAGCLGAIIQARVLYETVSGRELSFAEAADQMAATDAEQTTRPDTAKRAGYDAARAQYAERLRALYGV
jgi:xylulokinase